LGVESGARTLYRRPEVGESIMIMDGVRMPSLVGKGGVIVERPSPWRKPYSAETDDALTEGYNTCMVQLEGVEGIEYCFRIRDLLYEDMEADL
jgi:hypothetical protein